MNKRSAPMNYGAPREIALGTGAHGWPLAPSKRFPGETTLSCPQCGSINVVLSVIYGPGGRLGDSGATNTVTCKDCGKRDMQF